MFKCSVSLFIVFLSWESSHETFSSIHISYFNLKSMILNGKENKGRQNTNEGIMTTVWPFTHHCSIPPVQRRLMKGWVALALYHIFLILKVLRLFRTLPTACKSLSLTGSFGSKLYMSSSNPLFDLAISFNNQSAMLLPFPRKNWLESWTRTYPVPLLLLQLFIQNLFY